MNGCPLFYGFFSRIWTVLHQNCCVLLVFMYLPTTWAHILYKKGHHDLSFQINSPADVQNSLRDGVILCRLMSVIEPNSIKSVSNSNIPFKMMENINNFLDACEKIGVKKIDLFQTVDLYEGQNLSQVTRFLCIHYRIFAVTCQGFESSTNGNG